MSTEKKKFFASVEVKTDEHTSYFQLYETFNSKKLLLHITTVNHLDRVGTSTSTLRFPINAIGSVADLMNQADHHFRDRRKDINEIEQPEAAPEQEQQVDELVQETEPEPAPEAEQEPPRELQYEAFEENDAEENMEPEPEYKQVPDVQLVQMIDEKLSEGAQTAKDVVEYVNSKIPSPPYGKTYKGYVEYIFSTHRSRFTGPDSEGFYMIRDDKKKQEAPEANQMTEQETTNGNEVEKEEEEITLQPNPETEPSIERPPSVTSRKVEKMVNARIRMMRIIAGSGSDDIMPTLSEVEVKYGLNAKPSPEDVLQNLANNELIGIDGNYVDLTDSGDDLLEMEKKNEEGKSEDENHDPHDLLKIDRSIMQVLNSADPMYRKSGKCVSTVAMIKKLANLDGEDAIHDANKDRVVASYKKLQEEGLVIILDRKGPRQAALSDRGLLMVKEWAHNKS